MKVWNVIGTVTRYILAAVSCIYIAQFLLLLDVGTENAGRLAGQSLGRGVITGLVAAVWFYRARKASSRVPANVQTQLTRVEKVQSHAVPSPTDSVSTASSASAPIAKPFGSSFWDEQPIFIALTVVVVVVIVFAALTTVRSQQSWTMGARTSQPRFIHVQGAPSWQMFDNKTGQECSSAAVSYDSSDKIRADFAEQYRKLGQNTSNTLSKALTECEACVSETVDSLDSTDPNMRLSAPEFQEFYKRYDTLKANPNNPPVYHYDGMPYCKEL